MPPTMTTALAVAIKVYGGTITSSPGSTPAAHNAASSADVPLVRQIACSAPQNSANSLSNAFTFVPVVLPHFPL